MSGEGAEDVDTDSVWKRLHQCALCLYVQIPSYIVPHVHGVDCLHTQRKEDFWISLNVQLYMFIVQPLTDTTIHRYKSINL